MLKALCRAYIVNQWYALLGFLQQKSLGRNRVKSNLVINPLVFVVWLKALEKIWNITPLLCACAVVITLETQKCRKGAPRFIELFFLNRHRQKWLSQTQRKWADKQNFASDLLVFAPRLSYDFSKFSDNFTTFVQRWKTITKSLGKC